MASIAEDLLTLPPLQRRLWLLDHEPMDRARVFASVTQMFGTPYALYRDDPVGFIEDVLGEYIWSKQKDLCRSVAANRRTVSPAAHGPGKAVRNGTLVLTPTGWTKVEDLVPGDEVIAGDGTPTAVTGVYPQGVRSLYRLRFNDGAEVDADGEHLWATVVRRGPEKGSTRVLTTSEMLAQCGSAPTGWDRPRVPSVGPVAFPSAPVPLDPYLVGALLGDGCLTKATPTFSTADPEMLERIGFGGVRPTKSRPGDFPLLGLTRELRELGLIGLRSWEKHVPNVYLWNDAPTRLAMLRGLMDTDGCISPRDGEIEFSTTSPQLAEGVMFLARSLGAQVRRQTRVTSYSYRGEKRQGRRSYRVKLAGGPCPFALRRKAEVWERFAESREFTTDRLVVSITEVEPGEATCIAVAHPSKLFVLDAFIVTHNTWTAGRVVAWWCCIWPPGEGLAVTTAKRWRQVRSQLWPHVRRVGRQHDLPGRRLQTEWWIGDEQVAYGFAPNEYDEAAGQGIHAPHLLVVVDEAGGIPPLLGNNLDGLMTGDARILAIGNPPTDEEGAWFEKICASPLWNTIPISAFDSPNFTGEFCPPEIAAQLVDRAWVDDVRVQYGEDSAYYIARVLAQFPKVFAQKVIPVQWCEDAVANTNPSKSDWQRLGVDVASGGGDAMVVALADGWDLSVIDSWAGPDSADQVVNAERVLPWILRAQGKQKQLGYTERRVRVKLDGIGVGSGTADILERMGKDGLHDADIVKVIVSESPSDSGKFLRRRDECWWTMREVIRDGTIRLSVGAKTQAELCGPTWETNSSGKIVVESKQHMKHRGLSSPDEADACCLAVYEPVSVARTEVYDQLAHDPTELRVGHRAR